jgi:hypothetical protein
MLLSIASFFCRYRQVVKADGEDDNEYNTQYARSKGSQTDSLIFLECFNHP